MKTHELRRTVDGDASLDADGFTKLAADAFFFVHDGDLEELRVVGPGLHGNAIERTDVHAELAGRAGLRVDFGFGDGEWFDLFNDVADGIDDRLNRTVNAADTAIDAKRRIDVKNGFFLARDGFSRALDRAEGATDAGCSLLDTPLTALCASSRLCSKNLSSSWRS